MQYPLISEGELQNYGAKDTLVSRIEALYEQQKRTFVWLSDNLKNLSAVKQRSLTVNGDSVLVQYNPHRMRSVSASLSKADIEKRPCFLCPLNLPQEQKAIKVSENFVALCNPMPIFERHFTLCCTEHNPQNINGFLGELLELTNRLGSDYTVFFNGARAGASAPDHLHFQAAPAKDFPLLAKFQGKSNPGCTYEKFCGRSYLTYRSANINEITGSVSEALEKKKADGRWNDELLNLVCLHEKGLWTVFVIFRSAHRPSCYFASGAAQILVSPACVELSGFIVTPREEDFNKITAVDLEKIIAEVTDT